MKKREAVSHIMTKIVATAHRDQSVLDVRKLMEEKGVRHVPVVEGKNLIGIISRTDVLRASYGITPTEEQHNQGMLENVLVDAVMTHQPVSIHPDDSIREAAETLAELDFSALPVIDDGQLVGIITTTDLIRYLLEQY